MIMKRIMTIIVLAIAAMAAVAQQKKVDVRLDFPGKFDDMTEQELMAARGDMWADEWTNVTKPMLLDEIIKALNNRTFNPSFDFGRYPDARIILQFSVQNMDEDDGETTFFVTCYALGEDGTRHKLFYDSKEEDGRKTKNFTRIHPKAFREVATGIGFRFTRRIEKAVNKNPKLKEL